MLLAIDLGNTNTVFGVYDGERLVMHWRLSAQKDRTVDEFGILLRNLFALEKIDAQKIRKVIIASVVPPLDPVLNEMAVSYFSVKPIFVTYENAGIPVLYDDPREVGADRIVNAVAAIRKYGKPAIVVDFGTATTFDVITTAGEYRGGVIAPGIVISAEALYEHAAKLPRIEIQKPEKIIGTSTVASMQSGLFYGYVALVDGILTRMKKELGANTRVIGTGGQAPFNSLTFSPRMRNSSNFSFCSSLRILNRSAWLDTPCATVSARAWASRSCVDKFVTSSEIPCPHSAKRLMSF